MENRIQTLFNNKEGKILSVYFTAGYPKLNDTVDIIKELEQNGVDLIEIGIPFSDPVADGPVIQSSSEIAIKNGMTLHHLFNQLEKIRDHVSIPLILMGYFNPIMQFGIENFCQKCKKIGIDGAIIPDLPMGVYENDYKELFEKYNLVNIFLITPQTPESRIRKIDTLSAGFIYMVSSSSTTGMKTNVIDSQAAYFERIKGMKLHTKLLAGFGISDRSSFEKVCAYTGGAIIGSAFINALSRKGTIKKKVKDFVQNVI